MVWFGIKREPCGEVTAGFVYGPQFCGVLTLRRWRCGFRFFPICKDCDNER